MNNTEHINLLGDSTLGFVPANSYKKRFMHQALQIVWLFRDHGGIVEGARSIPRRFPQSSISTFAAH